MTVRHLTTIAALCFAAIGICNAAEQAYPSRPIRLVVPYPAGGGIDIFARTLARQVEIQLGQSIVVDNRGGANGIIAYENVAKAAPDGYTILSTAIGLAINPAIYKNLPYDTEKDFIPVTNFVNGPGYVMMLSPAVPARTVKEVIDLIKKDSKPMRFSSPGIGNGAHLAAELFGIQAGIPLLHIPYKGAAPANVALLGKEVEFTFMSFSTAPPYIKSGQLRPLGVTGQSRISTLPDVPTISEAGVPGYHFDSGWHGWFVPAKTPNAIVTRLYDEIRIAVATAKVRDSYQDNAHDPKPLPPAEFRKRVYADIKRYAELVRVAKIEPQ
jgi:tripartite-type tricarboxylate transporter receptor subunit TctC